jgi:hypothetical protein
MDSPSDVQGRFNGRLLHKVRKKRGWTQANLGRELGGLHFTLISKWEKYHEEPNEYRREQLNLIWPDVNFDEVSTEGSPRSWPAHSPPDNISGMSGNVRRERSADTAVVVYPQKVSWGPVNRLPAGIQIWSIKADTSIEEDFSSWEKLDSEITRILLPWILDYTAGHRFVTRDYYGKSDWLVWLVDQAGNWVCDMWFGGDPDKNWDFDGLIRFGDANSEPRGWITFQRYSDGTYRKLQSLCDTLDQMKGHMTKAKPNS